MNFSHPFFPRHSCLFKGGGGSQPAPVVTPPPVAAPAPTPTVLAAPAPAAPPPTATSQPVTVAQQDAKRAAAKKKGINSTILGEAESANSLGGNSQAKPTLLGGG